MGRGRQGWVLPLREYRTATRGVQHKITVYLRERAREPDEAPFEKKVRAWCSNQMGCVSMLRRPAGLAKIPAAGECIVDWVASTSREEGGGTTSCAARCGTAPRAMAGTSPPNPGRAAKC